MNESFRDRLLRTEQVTPALKERYEKEMKAMLEKRLTGVRRWVWLGGTLMSVVVAMFLGAMAIFPPLAEVPLPIRIGPAVGALFSVGFAILSLRIFRRGSMDLKFDTSVYIGMIWLCAVFTTTIFIVMFPLVPDRIVGLWLSIFGLVVLVSGAVFLIRHVIEQSELKTREKLLEIEYRLAELVETTKLGKT